MIYRVINDAGQEVLVDADSIPNVLLKLEHRHKGGKTIRGWSNYRRIVSISEIGTKVIR